MSYITPPSTGGVQWAPHECRMCGKRKVVDNRGNKKNPKGPDFKCLACGDAEWIDTNR